MYHRTKDKAICSVFTIAASRDIGFKPLEKNDFHQLFLHIKCFLICRIKGMEISILGCGWLGLPLAESLQKSGHSVKGSTTTKEKLQLLKGKNIEPFLITLNPELLCNDCQAFWDSTVLVLNIPPGRNREDNGKFHLEQIAAVRDEAEKGAVSRVIFISSTSVYPEGSGIVSEEDAREGKARRSSGNVLLKAEKMLAEADGFDTTVIRFGGLYGYDRHPITYLSGKKDLDRGSAPVNLIHCEDCVAIIKKVIEKNVAGEIFNAVTDGHPPREMYYRAAAEAMGLEKPTFKKDTGKNYKVVSNRKLKEELGYSFKYPNPLHFSKRPDN